MSFGVMKIRKECMIMKKMCVILVLVLAMGFCRSAHSTVLRGGDDNFPSDAYQYTKIEGQDMTIFLIGIKDPQLIYSKWGAQVDFFDSNMDRIKDSSFRVTLKNDYTASFVEQGWEAGYQVRYDADFEGYVVLFLLPGTLDIKAIKYSPAPPHF